MSDASGSAMIALLPVVTDWCKIRLPHLTLVYAGEIKDLSPGTFNDLAKDAASIAQLSKPLMLRSTGVDVFGGRGYDTEVDVITFEPTTKLLAMRRFVERWDKSEYPFNPHSTVGPKGSMNLMDRPPALWFDRIYVGYGEDGLTFWLNK